MSSEKVLICPYCGQPQSPGERCRACGGLFDPLSRRATHNAMGPWFVREHNRPFQPGCSYDTLVRLIERGRVTSTSIVRGPTTRQFWTVARRVPGISHLLGHCYQCDASVDAGDSSCHACGATFGQYLDRNFLGLPAIRPMPWEADEQDESESPAPTEEPAEWDGTDQPEPEAVTRTDSNQADAMDAPPAGQRPIEQPAGPRSGHAPARRGLSSFASDEELFGTAAGEPAPGHRGRLAEAPEQGRATAHLSAEGDRGTRASDEAGLATDGPSPSAGPVTMTIPTRAPAPAQQPERGQSPAAAQRADVPAARTVKDPAFRAMLERRRRQQQANRYLALGLSVLALVLLIIVIGRFLGIAAPATDEAERETNDAPTAAAPVESPSNDRQPAPMPPAEDAEPEDHPAPPEALDEPDEADGGDSPLRDVHLREYEEAMALIEDARDEERPLAQRIERGEEALALLRAIRGEVAADDQPENLEETIDHLRRLLHRLRLREFFP